MMPLLSRVVGMSMALPMADPPQMYTLKEFNSNHLPVRPWPLEVKCPVAFLIYAWKRFTYTTHSVELNSELSREEVVILKRLSYQM